MKKSTIISIACFIIALILYLFSLKIEISDFRLFVGVFIVLGLAFMTFSIKEDVSIGGSLLFKGRKVNKQNLITPQLDEFYLEHDTEYMLIDNSIFLKWDDKGQLEHLIKGIAASIGGVKVPDNHNEYFIFKMEQNSYIKANNLEDYVKSFQFKAIEKGSIVPYCSQEALMGKKIFKVFLLAMFVGLLIYMILQVNIQF